MRTFNNTDPAVQEKLKIFWRTEKYTPHAVCSSSEGELRGS